MKIKSILYSIVILILLSCNRKVENEPIQKSEKVYIDDTLVYEVVNTVLDLPEIKKDSAKYLLNTANIFMFEIGIDGENFYKSAKKHFGEIDTFSIENQIKKSRYSFYKQEYINNYQLVDYDITSVVTHADLDSLKKHSYKYLPNKSISYPVFNKTKTVAFISYNYDPHYAKSFFISKKNNKWEIIEYYEHYDF